ncbi:hypothetical protein [Streptomyces sp. SHP 1-2]|uniref:hypothetical protein n=1 Tax=Streptomyces sp. SHP 1-2 TaxID=2769489 RepID=UPI002237CCAE|nr:hypothetical protein [Streptomyces sp. SHP 1-2]MCW5252202.1 hypothetical protein [Streptomyces sp. SHP 1-2]
MAALSDSTGVAAVDAAVIWSIAAVAVAGGAALIWRGVRAARRLASKVEDFVDDWQGVEARPGVPERPGVMVRLDQIEAQVSHIQHELTPNSGSSLRDAVDRVDRRTRTMADDGT